MQNYSTVEEKALEWNLSLRHVQYLCRNGRIEDAIKRAGSWFILSDTPSPAVNSKSGAGSVHFVGTKKRVFLCAIELFARKGFDNVSLRDIAVEVGIRQSTIYNHFRSKQDVISAIYDYFSHCYMGDILGADDLAGTLKSMSPMEIVDGMHRTFVESTDHIMHDITKIILQRIGLDERAQTIGASMMVNDSIGYAMRVFDKAVELGSLPPLDTHAMAVFVNSVKIFTLFRWIMDPSPENIAIIRTDEHMLYRYGADLLADRMRLTTDNMRMPPGKGGHMRRLDA